jgi:cation diffusion facilitator family transporter
LQPSSLPAHGGLRAARLNLIIGTALLLLKFQAFRITGAQAIFSDAMESIVNVAAAALALALLNFAAKPADRDHPYGHGKAEYFSAAFEGGMIAIAAIWIALDALQALLLHHVPQRLEAGLLWISLAGVVNLALGLYLIRTGRKSLSPTLVASGQHLLSDFITTLGVVLGLVLVLMTGLNWLDPTVALLVAVHLGWVGLGLVRSSLNALLDSEDAQLIGVITETVNRNLFPGIIRLHHTRVIRAGRHHHIDAHVVVPEFWTVERAHQETEKFEAAVLADYPFEGEIAFHLDPCRRAYCAVCSVADCSLRQHPFRARLPHTIQEITNPVEPESLPLEV